MNSKGLLPERHSWTVNNEVLNSCHCPRMSLAKGECSQEREHQFQIIGLPLNPDFILWSHSRVRSNETGCFMLHSIEHVLCSAYTLSWRGGAGHGMLPSHLTSLSQQGGKSTTALMKLRVVKGALAQAPPSLWVGKERRELPSYPSLVTHQKGWLNLSKMGSLNAFYIHRALLISHGSTDIPDVVSGIQGSIKGSVQTL